MGLSRANAEISSSYRVDTSQYVSTYGEITKFQKYKYHI